MAKRVLRLLVKQAAEPLAGELAIPSSKYHAHRALILASLASGTSYIHGLSDAGHVRYTIGALRRLGTKITVRGDTFIVEGGPYRPSAPLVPVGSSGSTLYFLTGLTSLAGAPVTVVGQKYFRRRPILPLLDALSGLGVELSSTAGCPPIEVSPRRPKGGHVTISGMLSQWISGLLLLAPFATGSSVVSVDGPLNERSYIDLTVRMMAEFGLHVEMSEDARRFEVEGNQTPRPATLHLPPDVGAAAFGLAVTALHPSDVVFRGLTARSAAETDHPEAELLDIVGRMGLPLDRDPASGQVRVCHDGLDLAPVEVDCRSVPDALPVLSVLGTFAKGASVLHNVAHVRLKESDRVSAMLQLNNMGARLELSGDRLVVSGVDRLRGADLSSFNDHRVLMSLAVAATRAEGESRLTYPTAYRISYPRFLEEMGAIGASMAVEEPTAPRGGERAGAGGQAAGLPGVTRRGLATRLPAATRSPERLAAVPIGEHVRRWAQEHPESAAVVDVAAGGGHERLWTWADLDRKADAVALALARLGVSPGEAVAYQLPNVGEFAVVSLGVLRAGAVCCPLMPIYREREMAFMLRRSRAHVLFVPGHFRGREYPAEVAGLLAGEAGEPPELAHVIVVDGEAPEERGEHEGERARRGRRGWHRYADLVERSFAEGTAGGETSRASLLASRAPAPTALAQLLFTSGTSGEPKGVLHRMATLTRAAAMEANHLGLSKQDTVFVPSPLAHQTGFLYGMWLAWVLGAPQVLQATWDGKVALRALNRWGATFVQAATPFLNDLLAAVEETGERPERLRVFVATGAAVPRGLAERASRTLGTAVCGAWGTTETCLGSLSAPYDEPAKTWGTDGRALEGVRLRISDDLGNVLASGQEGNFEVFSKCMFEGYLDHPEWTAEAFTPDGWYRSGDLAVIDESGYVRISGRVKDVINRGGEKVPVAEIEQLLHTHPALDDVAIVAMPDERLGERACAFVVARTAFGLDDMRSFLDSHRVAKHYWPERLEIIEGLPRNPVGKVQKYVLRDLAQRLVEEGRGC
jgi:cyclohexanecarboxylate-CoA ligase